MKSLKLLITFIFLCSAIQAWSYTNPIDGSTTETVTNLWNLGTNSLQVGLTTDGNAMIVTNGGIVVSTGGTLGNRDSADSFYSHSNQVVVTGVGSTWISSGDVRLATHNNELLITDGGHLDSVSGQVGGAPYGDNNLVTVSGSGSIWSNSAALKVGAILASNNAVIITNGGHLYSNGGVIDDDQAAFGGRVTVTGPGSLWKNTGSLVAAWGGELLISDGGKVENTDAVLQRNFSGPARVAGAGSTWINSGKLSVGQAELLISDGGRVESNEGEIFLLPSGTGKVTVTGTDSIWINSGQLNIWGGELIITDGGRLESGSADINDGGNATVTGTGSIWNNTENLTVDGGSVTVSNGGTISTASLVIQTNIYDNGNGAFHLQSGGKLTISSNFNAAQPGTFDFSGGTLSVSGTLSNFFLLADGCRLEAVDLAGDLTVHGTFAPGQSPADTMLDGAFVLATDGGLEMELAGYLLGTEYDHLTVTGESTLDGTFTIILLDGFAPVYGDTFDLFDWEGGVSGTFAVTNMPALGNGLYWDTTNLYTTGTVTVVPEPATFMLLGIGGLFAGLVRKWSRVSV
jgi:T5SS/PEP-CTERM-associated repeat protein